MKCQLPGNDLSLSFLQVILFFR